MNGMPCITCKNPLRENGKITPDYQWAYCTICGARYEIIAAMDEDGKPQYAPDGQQTFYLNPVAHGEARFFKEDSEEALAEIPEDFDNLKHAIRSSDTVQDFFKSLKKLNS